MNIKVFKKVDDIGEAAATIFSARVIAKPDCVLGLATGSTPIPTYKHMIKLCKKGMTDYSRVATFNLDEYIGLDHSHNQSYYYFMQENLFKGINVPSDNIHVPSGIGEDIDRISRDYDAMIDAAGGVDIQILGIGQNGHIAFNEPCDEFPMGTHKVALTENTIEANARFFKNKDEVPKFAITMGIGTIMKAKKIIMVATGANKADAVWGMIEGKVRPQMPASILQMHSDVTVFCDEAAASKLTL